MLVQGDQLAGMWTAALPLGLEGKMAAIQASLEFIGTPAPPIASAHTGAQACIVKLRRPCVKLDNSDGE